MSVFSFYVCVSFMNQNRMAGLEGECEPHRQETVRGTHYIKKVSHRFLKIQVLCCFLLLLLFCHMALVIGFQIFRSERLDDAYAVVVDVDNLITLAVEVVSG